MTSPDDSHREQALTNRTSEGAEKSSRESEDFIRAALNALASSIAILDGRGVILEVNDTWVQFAEANGYDSPPYGVGADYLDLLRRAAAAGDRSAQPILDGLTAVLSGGLPQFEYEYPCHSPRERRWFILNARPLPAPHSGAVVAHNNITGRKLAEERLRVSEERLRLAAQTSGFGFHDYDAERGTSYWTPELYELSGVGEGTAITLETIGALIHPDDRERVVEKMRAALDPRGTGEFAEEFRTVRPDNGETRWTFNRSRTLFTGEGAGRKALRNVGVVADITASKRADTALRESRERLAATYSNAPIGIVETDLDGSYLSVNDEFCRISGYARDELLRLNLRDITHEEDYPRNRALFERLVAGEFPSFRLEKRYVRKDGSIVWADIHRTLIRDARGNPLYVIGAVADITERKLAEEQSRVSERRLQRMVNVPRVGVLTFDHAGTLLDANDAFLEMVGYTREEVAANTLTWRDLTPPEYEAASERVMESLLTTGRGGPYEKEYFCKDGSRIWLMFVAADLGDATIVEYAVDITERKRAEEALRESVARFDIVRDSAQVGFWFCDLPFDKLMWDNRVKEHFWLPPDAEVTIDTFYERLHPDDRERTRRAIDESIANKTQYEIEYRTVASDGREKWIRAVGRTFYNAQENPIRFDGVTLDITTRKQAEEQLRRNHETFFNLVKNTPFGVYIVDADFRLVEISEGSRKVFGNIEPLIGRDFAEILRIVWEEPFASEAIAIFRRTLETGEPYHAYNTVEQRGNKEDVESYDWKIERVTLPDGRFGVVCYFYDLTKQKQIQEALRQSEERFRLASDAAAALVYDVDLTGERAVVAHGLERVTGYTNEGGGLTSEWWHSLIHPDDLPAHLENDERQLKGGGKHLAAYRIRRKDGAWIWVEDTAQVIRDEAGANLQLVGAIVDITARKRADEERERLLREAEEANRLKDEFLATASHELRTPLTAVVGWTRMLRTGDLDEATSARALETIERNAGVQTKLIEDLLDISRIITGKLLLDTQPVEVAPVVSAAVNTVRPAADAKNIEIEASLDAEAGAVMADANRLQQVVWNLLSNAVKFTPREGRVSVKLRRVDSQVEISVSDTGEGIEPEFLPYVFDRFRQADGRTTRRHGGLGLGLAIVRNLVELHGGTVRAHSEGRGRGAIFSVRLPLLGLYRRVEAPALPLTREETEAPDVLGIECPPKLDGLRVLVVDDDPDTREMLEAVLSQCEAQVVTVASAAEALREIGRRRPDVLVSDIGMPDEDGYELIKKVRESENLRGETATPALALTAYAKAEDRVRALAAGYQVHLSKPVEPAEFALVVASLVGRGSTPG